MHMGILPVCRSEYHIGVVPLEAKRECPGSEVID